MNEHNQTITRLLEMQAEIERIQADMHLVAEGLVDTSTSVEWAHHRNGVHVQRGWVRDVAGRSGHTRINVENVRTGSTRWMDLAQILHDTAEEVLRDGI